MTRWSIWSALPSSHTPCEEGGGKYRGERRPEEGVCAVLICLVGGVKSVRGLGPQGTAPGRRNEGMGCGLVCSRCCEYSSVWREEEQVRCS